MGNKNEIVNICAKTYLLYGNKRFSDWEILRQFSDKDILPSKRQLNEWRIYREIKNKIKNGEITIKDELGIFTNSFINGLKDSGIFQKSSHTFRFNKNSHKEFYYDLLESKLPIKISKPYKHGTVNISNCLFLWLGIKEECNINEYFGGLFTGGCVINNRYLITPKSKESFDRVISLLNNYKMTYENKNGQIFISPFYGALFYGYMPIHSASRVINVQNAFNGAKLALVYWNMVREIGRPVAPIKAHILPFARSYATYWNSGMLKKTDIRKMGVDIGVIGISDGLRDLMKEWIKHHL